jgi:GT2 family glycosyltransferase
VVHDGVLGIFVLGTLPADVASVVAMLSRLSVADVGDRLGPVDREMLASLDEQRHDGADLGQLLDQARRHLPAGPWVYGATGLERTLPLWRQAVLAPPVAIAIDSELSSVVAQLTAWDRRTTAVAMALWERRARQMLDAVDGLEALVVGPSPAAAEQVGRFLEGVGLVPDWTGPDGPQGGRPPALARARSSALPVSQLSSSQAGLRDLLQHLHGEHHPLSTPALPRESAATAALVDADRCYERQLTALEGCVATAVSAVQGLAPPPSPAPPAFEQRYGLDAAEDVDGYARWLMRGAARAARRRVAAASSPLPGIGVVVAFDRAGAAQVQRCLDSVRGQTYGGWHAYVGAGPEAVEQDGLDRLAPERFSVTQGSTGGPAQANAAAAMVEEPFVAFVDQHDELAPSALQTVAEALAADPDVDVLYSDEDEIDNAGRRTRPQFKPDWSPDHLLSTMYTGRLLVVRHTLLEQVGGLRPEYGQSAGYDLVLRVTERARKVGHVAEVLYHRRAGSTGDEHTAARAATDTRALESALARRGEDATVEPGLCPGSYRVRRRIRSAPLVSIIVPFRDGAELLRRCVESIHRTAGYDAWELVLIDNQSWEPETAALRRRLEKDDRVRLVDYPHPYNWSSLNNFGARHARGDMLLFLNSDVEGSSPGWLAAMVEHAQRPEVGAVGARLLYPDGRIQHAGVVMGMGGIVAWHAFCFCPGERAGYLGMAKMIRNYSVVTGACMLVRRDAFDAVGGLDESLAICFNDVELCLRMRERGLLVVYTPFAELIHAESSTRGVALEQDEIDVMFRRWAPVIADDPYFNPNLDRRRTEFALPR